MRKDDWKQTLDHIAARNGCKITDYNLAWYSKQKSYREEWMEVLMYFGAGLVVGALLVHLGLL